MTPDDVVTTLTLGLCATLAVVFPRSLWPWAARKCASAHLVVKEPNLTATCETLSAQGVEITSGQIAHDLLSGNYLEIIETVSEYLGYDGQKNVVVEGVANVTKALENGRGVILWHTPFHGASLFEKRGYRRGGIAVTHLRAYDHPFSSTAFGLRVLNPVKTRIEDKYLMDVASLQPTGARPALEKLTQRLKENQVVSVTASGSGKNAVGVPFLGGGLKLARGVPSLAYPTGALVVPTASAIHPGPKYVIEFGAPLAVDYGLSEAEFRYKLVEAYAEFLAVHVSRRPGSWRGWILPHTWQPRYDPADR